MAELYNLYTFLQLHKNKLPQIIKYIENHTNIIKNNRDDVLEVAREYSRNGGNIQKTLIFIAHRTTIFEDNKPDLDQLINYLNNLNDEYTYTNSAIRYTNLDYNTYSINDVTNRYSSSSSSNTSRNPKSTDNFDQHLEQYRESKRKEIDDKFAAEQQQLNKQCVKVLQNIAKNAELCSICFESKVNSCTNPCGHLNFCHKCITDWTNTNHNCPMCKNAVSSVIKIYK